jgi:hypothetical protein
MTSDLDNVFVRAKFDALEAVSLYFAANRDRFWLEPSCGCCRWFPSAVRSRLSRPPSATATADEDLNAKIRVIFDANYCVYGCRKIKAALVRGHRSSRGQRPCSAADA